MSNPVKGEIGFEVEGQAYTLVLDVNALCAVEAELDIKASDLSLRVSQGLSLTELRAVFWAGLQEHHPGVKLHEAGRLIGALGPVAATGKMVEAIAAAWSSAGEGEGARPPKGAASPPTG